MEIQRESGQSTAANQGDQSAAEMRVDLKRLKRETESGRAAAADPAVA